MVGMSSYYDFEKKDRRFEVYYTNLIINYKTTDCWGSGKIKTYGNDMPYTIQNDRVITGIYSSYNRYSKDRVWYVHTCKIVRCNGCCYP